MEKRRLKRSILFIIAFIFIFNIYQSSIKAISKIDSEENIAILVDLTEERLYLINKDKNTIVKNIA